MAFVKVCNLDDLWEGEMAAFEVNGHEVLLVSPEGSEIRAFQGIFDGKVVICRAHQWVFDGCTGKSINPANCRLAEYPVRIDGENVLVDTDGVTPVFAQT